MLTKARPPPLLQNYGASIAVGKLGPRKRTQPMMSFCMINGRKYKPQNLNREACRT